MNVIESVVEGIPLIVVEGDLDQSSKPAVLEALHYIFREGHSPQKLLVDLTDCAFLDSGGLSVLLTAMALLPAGGWLGIIGVSAGPNRVLEYTGFLTMRKCASSPPATAPPLPLLTKGNCFKHNMASRPMAKAHARVTNGDSTARV